MATKAVYDRIIGFKNQINNGSTVVYDSRRNRLGFDSSASKNTYDPDGAALVGVIKRAGSSNARNERKSS